MPPEKELDGKSRSMARAGIGGHGAGGKEGAHILTVDLTGAAKEIAQEIIDKYGPASGLGAQVLVTVVRHRKGCDIPS